MKGYKENFIDSKMMVPLPEVSEELIGHAYRNDQLRDAIYLDYEHYTLVMNKTTKQLIFAASNLDQQLLKKTTRGRWNTDSRIDFGAQLNNLHYKNNRWDRGHMVRRATNAWGESKSEAQKADNATMYYTNASFQHENFNQDEWLALENMFKDFDKDKNGRVSIFTGPIHNEYDRYYTRHWHDSVRIPSGFFKIICFLNNEGALETRAFVMYQDEEALKDKRGSRRGFNLKNYQVTITEVEHLTGLEFHSTLYDSNPLYYNENEGAQKKSQVKNFPERVLIEKSDDVIHGYDAPRTKVELPSDEQTVRILAAMINPSGNESDKEWITLFNLTAKTVDLSGWQLRDRNKTLTIKDASVEAGSSVLVHMKDYPDTVRLSNKGNSLTLVDQGGRVVDSIVYNESQAKKEDWVVVL